MKNDRGTYIFFRLCEVLIYIFLFLYPEIFVFNGGSEVTILLRGASLILAIRTFFGLLELSLKNRQNDEKDKDGDK